MKKYLSFFAIALFTFGFAACSDVPSPYSLFFEDEDEGGSVAAETLPFAESFSNSLGKFTSLSVKGNFSWTKQSYNGGCAVITSFVDTDGDGTKENNEAEVWLVSPTFDLSNISTAHVSFDYILAYAEADQVATNYLLKVSKNYKKGDQPNNADWENIPIKLVTANNYNTWLNSGKINVPSDYCNQEGVVFALVYITTTKAATWEVQNFVVEEGEGETFDPSGGGGGNTQPTDDYILHAPFSSALTSNLGDFLTWDNNQSGYNWTHNSTYKCAYITSYESATKTNHPADSWLISPAFDLSNVTEAYVTLDYKLAYASGNNDEYRVLIGKGFPGEGASPGRIDWTQLSVTWTMLSSFSGAAWSNTGKLPIPTEFLGQSDIRVAIEYISTTKAATWEIQNLIVAKGAGDDPSGGGEQGGGNEQGSGGNEPDVTGSTITVSAESMGLANAAEISSFTFPAGVSWTFAQNEGSNAPKYYAVDKSARLYSQNSVKITSVDGRPIKAIVFNCSPTYNGTNYRGNEQMTTSSGTISKDATAETVTISGINASEVTVKNAYTQNSSGTQLRIVSMQVVFNDGSSTRRR